MNKEKGTVYTIATAHLDTSWLWTYEQTAAEFNPDTFIKNFKLMKKFPTYKFNYEGSLRYELLKEYQPHLYEQLKGYIKEGRWNPCGSCYENGDVNIPSPEALIRNILYGNGYFEDEFGVASNDIFLPDCFGFGRALPTVAAHCGLKGFSTGKLVWGSAADVPFHIGRWNGIDGKGIWLATNTGSYTTALSKIRQNKRILEKLSKNISDYNMPVAFCYHGNGDRGDAPHTSSVRAVCDAAKENGACELKVLSATTKEFFDTMDAMPQDAKNKAPQWNSELLLTEHGAGSYTARTVTKRWNRRSEQLADAAERFAVAAFVNGYGAYPQYGFDAAWKKVLAHHFHDDITGTSFEECYKRSYNDYVQAMHTFSEEYTAANKAILRHADTSFVKGTAVVVSNPVQGTADRRETVRVQLQSDAQHLQVFDCDGNEVASQVQYVSDASREVVFLASVPSCGYAVYDVRPADKNCEMETALSVTQSCLENKNLIVKINADGDICSVYDKRLARELLRSPIRPAILNNVHSFRWPAWEIKFEDVSTAPYMYPSAPIVKIKESGSAYAAIEIIRTAGKSRFTQVISLDAESEYVSVYNETDWREEASLLKMQFHVAADNDFANYDIGIGYTQRAANTKRLYEVPAQKWADITDQNGDFGVAVFSDSRTGWDRPEKDVLRLTCIHTPMASYRHECAQHLLDMGLNRYSFAICGHAGAPGAVSASADAFCQPMHTFVSDNHKGDLPARYSFANLNNDSVRITAIKKAQKDDKIILRVAECAGKKQTAVTCMFAKPVKAAYEVTGDEKILREVPVADGKIVFDTDAFGVHSFALVFDAAEKCIPAQQKIKLDCNERGITDNNTRGASSLIGGISLPAEMIPDSLLFAGVEYDLVRSGKNCVVCKGQELAVPDGFPYVHLLLTSLSGDRTADFVCGDEKVSACVPACNEAIGMWDLMASKITGYIKPTPQALSVSHTHKKDGDIIGKQCYLFHVSLPVNGAKSVRLPDDENIVVFAATAADESGVFAKGDLHFDRLEKRPFDYEFSKYAKRHATENAAERFLDNLIDRTRCFCAKADGGYSKNSVAEIYFGVNFAFDMLLDKSRRERILKKRSGK